MRAWVTSIVEIAGAALIVLGAAFVYWPSGLIVAGILMVVFAYRAAE